MPESIDYAEEAADYLWRFYLDEEEVRKGCFK